MGRGSQSKHLRAHRRAKEAGRSTRGSSQTGAVQRKGKKYKKGEINFADNPNDHMSVVYNSKEYRVEYHINTETRQLCIVSVVDMNIVNNQNMRNHKIAIVNKPDVLRGIAESLKKKLTQIQIHKMMSQ